MKENTTSGVKSRTFGYIRVSTKDQNEQRQLDAFMPYEIPTEYIFIDKQSGKNFERPKYKELLRKLGEKDLVVIKSIDRLGRNYQEIMEQWRIITKEIGADIHIIDMPLLDTTVCKDLMGTFVSDLVLQILSFVAENEREIIHQRQKEGIAAAKARGVRFGRPKKESTEFLCVSELYRQKKIPLDEALKRSGLSRSTFYKRMKMSAESPKKYTF